MVRTCQADDALSERFEAMVKERASAEVGLLVGRYAAGSKALLLGVVKTPCTPEGAEAFRVTSAGAAAPASAAAKGSKKAGASSGAASAAAELDEEWVSEHARQVGRMLPGGLSVVGIYIFCPDAACQAAALPLGATLRTLFTACPPPTDPETKAPEEVLQLHVDSSTRKQTLKAAGQAPGASLKPLELKYGPVLANMIALRCRHALALALPATSSGAQLKQLLQQLVGAEAQRIRSGMLAANGALLSGDAPLVESLPSSSLQGGADGGGGPPAAELSFLCPLPCAAAGPSTSGSSSAGASTAGSSGVCLGQGALRGALQGLAYVSKREPTARALADLKADLVRTLQIRLELLQEEAQLAAEEAAQQQGTSQPAHPLLVPTGGGASCALALPRRVLLPWKGGLQCCDYLGDGEPAAAAADRAKELLAVASSSAQVEEVEAAAALPANLAAWDPYDLDGGARSAQAGAKGRSAAQPQRGGQGGSSSSLPCSAGMLAGLAVAALASAIGVLTLQPAR